MSSIQDVLRSRIEAIGDDDHPAIAPVRVRIGKSIVLAQLARKSAADLCIGEGAEIWAQVKSVALLD